MSLHSNSGKLMASASAVVVIVTVLYCCISSANAGTCPELEPVGIDKQFLIDAEAGKGFYANLVSGVDKMPDFKVKKMKSVSGDAKVCYKVKLKISGKEKFDAPPVSCSGPTYSQFTCKLPAIGAALTAVGIKTPKTVLNTVVATDNKTFLAMGGCLDGSEYMWAILSTEKGNKKVRESTLKALHISVDDLKESENKKYKNGQTHIAVGVCKKGGLAGLLDG